VLAGFLGFLLTPVTRWLKKIGFSNFWAPLLGTVGFLAVLICLFSALCLSLSRFEPDFPRYLDHIQDRLTPILQVIQKSSPSIDRLGAWLNPGNILPVSIRGPSIVEMALMNAPKFFATLIIVHVLAFFLLLYGARLLKKLVDMIPGVPEKQNVVEIASEIEQTAARYFTSITLITCLCRSQCLDLRGIAGTTPPVALGCGCIFAPLHSLRRSDGWYRGNDACFNDSF
jgi:predicted PurR-regulated permease PerM